MSQALSGALRLREDELGCPEASVVHGISDGNLEPASGAIRDGMAKRGKQKKTKRPYNVKNKNRPKRPLSAYNIFFRHERARLLKEAISEKDGCDSHDATVEKKIAGHTKTKTGRRVHRKTHGAIGFAELGRRISAAWKNLDEKDRAPFQAEADNEKQRYQRQMEAMLRQPKPVSKNHHPGEYIAGYGAACDSRHKNAEDRNRELNKPPGYRDYYNQLRRQHPPDNFHYYASQGQQSYDDYYGSHSSGHRQATLHHNGHGSASGYVPHPNPAYFGYQELRTTHYEDEELKTDTGNPHKQMAHEFSPPYPTNNYYHSPRHPQGTQHSVPGESCGIVMGSEPESQEREYAFQCEVCNIAVFSTFRECADHELQCGGRQYPKPEYERAQPASVKAEAKEKQQAVEAVMMLKKPIEC